MAGHASSNDGDTDWRRLASDRNVSHGVARALWEQARAASPDDPVQAQHAYQAMLDDAEHANASHEPGRETLVGAAGARDAASLGPGKLTRVLLEQPRAAAAPIAMPDAVKKATADAIRAELAAAGQAGKQAIDAIAAADGATIAAALRELGSQQTGLVGKLMAMASGAVEKLLDRRDEWVAKQPAPPAKPKREDDGSEDGDAVPAEDDAGHAAPAAPPPPPEEPTETSEDDPPKPTPTA